MRRRPLCFGVVRVWACAGGAGVKRRTLDDDAMLEAGLPRIADQVEGVDETDKADLAVPALAVDQNIPGVDVTAGVNISCSVLG